MFLHQITINTLLFIIGFFGVTLNYNSILITLMGIELMLLSASMNFIIYSLYLNEIYGQIFSIFILTVAASESSIGLALLIVLFKLTGTITLTQNAINKG
jgi:NADH-quinone oxidoreductase subunit K